MEEQETVAVAEDEQREIETLPEEAEVEPDQRMPRP